jgi:hypothetical protein
VWHRVILYVDTTVSEEQGWSVYGKEAAGLYTQVVRKMNTERREGVVWVSSMSEQDNSRFHNHRDGGKHLKGYEVSQPKIFYNSS